MKVAPEILKLKPYKAGKPIQETKREYGLSRVYKLASNENPQGPSPRVVEALKVAVSEVHLYPDASCYELRQGLSEAFGVPPESMSFGNGSNEVIDLLIRLFCENGDSILTSQAAFIAYKICAQAARVKTIEVPLTDGLKFDLPAFAEQMDQAEKKPRLVFIANPNNPTGTYVSNAELTRFLERSRQWPETLVVLDEAYYEYVRVEDYPSSLELQKDFPQLIVLRTLSKAYGLAGLRVGAMIAQPDIIELFDRVRNPFNVNHLAQVAALAAVKDKEYLQKSRELNSEGLDYFYAELDRLGLKYWPSQGNFVLFDCERDGKEVVDALLKEGVILRAMTGWGLPSSLVRMSVGLPEENKAAMVALTRLIQGDSIDGDS